MMDCEIGVTPIELLIQRPMGLLALRGSDGEDEGAKPEDKPKEGDDADEKSKSGAEGGEGTDEDKPKEESRTLSEDDFRRWQNYQEERERNVNKRREAEAEVKKLQRQIDLLKKDGISDEDVAKEIKDLRGTTEKLQSTNQKLALENAFLKDNKYKWINPARALQLADLTDVEIDEDGKVHGLKTALDALAKSDPYLLQAEEKIKDEPKPKPDNTGKPPRSGKGGGSDEAARAAALRAKYPGLRR